MGTREVVIKYYMLLKPVMSFHPGSLDLDPIVPSFFCMCLFPCLHSTQVNIPQEYSGGLQNDM